MGIIGRTRALSATLGDEGITINAVVPSLTNTAMAERVPEAIVNDSVGRQVIHRMAEPADIAGAVAIVASDAIEYATRGIRANAVSPSIIKTPMHAEEQHEALGELLPVGRMGEVSVIVGAVVYLENAPTSPAKSSTSTVARAPAGDLS